MWTQVLGPIFDDCDMVQGTHGVATFVGLKGLFGIAEVALLDVRIGHLSEAQRSCFMFALINSFKVTSHRVNQALNQIMAYPTVGWTALNQKPFVETNLQKLMKQISAHIICSIGTWLTDMQRNKTEHDKHCKHLTNVKWYLHILQSKSMNDSCWASDFADLPTT